MYRRSPYKNIITTMIYYKMNRYKKNEIEYIIINYNYILKNKYINKILGVDGNFKNIIQKLHYYVHKGKNGNLKISDNHFNI